jgi:CRISPR-associated protein Cas1
MAKQLIVLESDLAKRFSFSHDNLKVVDETGKTVLQHSCHRIFAIFVIGDGTVTTVLIKNLKKHGISTVFLAYNLKVTFSFLPESRGNFLLREKQYRHEQNLSIAKQLIANKIENQIFLMQSLRYRTSEENEAIETTRSILERVPHVQDAGELLGIEGNAAKHYFSTYFKNTPLTGRKPRCKSDPYNLLLDIGYTYLFNYIEANLELYGFDTYYGVFHTPFYQRKSLVCDIVEPFRCVIDRRLRKAHNLKQINLEDFEFTNGQYVLKRGFAKKYTALFFRDILDNKEAIFLFIQAYYRSFMHGKPLETYPRFTLC